MPDGMPGSLMRAAVMRAFGEPERIEECDWPTPQPKPGEVQVQVHAVPVNYVDLVVATGKYQFLPTPPFIPGKGPAGIVTGLGEGVQGLRLGDRVLAMAEIGGYAQAVCVSASQCYRLPETLGLVEAAAMSLAFDTAWFALKERGRLQHGEWVLVLGASGAVGFAAVQLAKAMGARVLAGIARPALAAAVLAAGADAVVTLAGDNLRESLRTEVRALTDGHGADVVVDMVGGDVFDAAVRAMAWCGRLVVVGFAAGRIPGIRTNYLLVKNIEISGLQISDYRKRRPERLAECFREIFDFHSAGLLHPNPSEVLPLRQAGAALARLRDRTVTARLLLDPR